MMSDDVYIILSSYKITSFWPQKRLDSFNLFLTGLSSSEAFLSSLFHFLSGFSFVPISLFNPPPCLEVVFTDFRSLSFSGKPVIVKPVGRYCLSLVGYFFQLSHQITIMPFWAIHMALLSATSISSTVENRGSEKRENSNQTMFTTWIYETHQLLSWYLSIFSYNVDC